MNEWKWSKANEKDLAKFVNANVIQLLPKLPENSFDLVHKKKGRRDLIETIYKTLVRENIQYDYEKPQTEEETQLIRTPSEILSSPGKGTCLDLALLFCGVCFGYNLLPLLIMIEGHALVAVSLNHQRSQWNDSGRCELHLFQGKNGEPELLAGEDKLKVLQQLIESDDEAYIAVECTGFAQTESFDNLEYPEARGRENGFLDYSRALKAGSEQLFCKNRPFQFAIDIAVAQDLWKIEPLKILSKPANSREVNVAQNIEVQVEDETTGAKARGKEAMDRNFNIKQEIKESRKSKTIGWDGSDDAADELKKK
jgi:Transglutaminase-like domain